MGDSVDRLYAAVLAARHADPASSRTARLLRAGRAKMAKKLAEEAVEVIIDAMHGSRDAVVRESAETAAALAVRCRNRLRAYFLMCVAPGLMQTQVQLAPENAREGDRSSPGQSGLMLASRMIRPYSSYCRRR